MTEQETAKILSVLCATYPNSFTDIKKSTLAAWHFALSDHDYRAIAEALKIYINTSNSAFAPSVSQLIGMTHKSAELNELNEISAWTLVRQAIGKSTYYAEEEFNKLPELVKKTVGSPEQLRAWATGNIDSVETVVASNFQRTYRSMLKRQEQIELLPAELRERLGINSNLAIERKS